MRFKILILFFPLCLHAQPGFYEPWGKDADLKRPTVQAPTPTASPSLLVKMGEQIITFHQQILSPADGPRSHFIPSSSQYMRLALRKYGFFKGFALGCDRLLRENDAEWVYRTINSNGTLYKYNPVP